MYKIRASLLVVLISCVAATVGFGEIAFGQGGCGVTIIKDAPGGNGTIFEYEITLDGGLPFVGELPGGESTGGPFDSTVTVTELPKAGWELADVTCENLGATGFEITENGFTASCDGGGEVICTFFNVATSRSVPTLSEWGIIAMAVVLGATGLYITIRRKKAMA